MSAIQIATVEADGASVFYRFAGPPDGKVVLLLHGFPTSSHQYISLMTLLAAANYRVLAPDLPGFGFTKVPARFNYTFDALADTVSSFLTALKVEKFAMYIFDYGAPTGLRIALQRPDDVLAIVTQNGNAYEEGLGENFWGKVRRYWESGSLEDREALRPGLSFEGVRAQYEDGETAPESIPPENYYLDYFLMTRPGNDKIQLDLFYDYRTNVALYPAFQKYFRESQVPLLAAWGKNDWHFIPEGAEAYKRDLPNAEVVLLDAGHFAGVTKSREIGDLMIKFLSKAC